MKVFKDHITGDVFYRPDRDRSSSVRRTSKRLNYRESELDTRLLSYEKIKREGVKPTRLNQR